MIIYFLRDFYIKLYALYLYLMKLSNIVIKNYNNVTLILINIILDFMDY